MSDEAQNTVKPNPKAGITSLTSDGAPDHPLKRPPLKTTDISSDTVTGPDEIHPSEATEANEKNEFDEPVENPLDKLNFRPLALREWFLLSTLIFNVIVVGLLLIITFRQNFTLLDEWAYFVIQILPLLVGTLTSTTLESIMLELSRITPFIRCAQPDGDTIANTILKPFMPLLGILDSVETKNYHLLPAPILQFAGGLILGLKASLLSSSYPDISVNVTNWTLYSLFVVYGVIILYILYIMFYLKHHKTGLRKDWDVVTMADHLTLFRRSNLRRIFEGSCIATRPSMKSVLGDTRIKLGYWKRKDKKMAKKADESEDERKDGSQWYGFRAIFPETGDDNPIERRKKRGNATLKLDKISSIRYLSSFHQMRSPGTIISLTFALALLVAYLTALSMGSSRDPKNVFHLPTSISTALAEFAFPFLLTLVVGLYSVFWEDMYMFTIITQPYEAMSRQRKGGVASDAVGLAEDTLLLPYSGMPRYVAMFEALTRGHWKVFRVALFALLQRVLPIVVGASVTIWPPDENGEGGAVEFSTPLSIVTIVWMVVYLAVIPYEILESGYTRHLPRANITIADLLSWTCSSRLLCDDGEDANAVEAAADDHDSSDEIKEGGLEARQSEKTRLLAGNPLDVFAEGRLSQKWFMEARLRIASEHTRFGFGLDEIFITPSERQKLGFTPEKKLYTLGINSVDATGMAGEATLLEIGRKSEGLRRGIGVVAADPDPEGRGASGPEDSFEVYGAGEPLVTIMEPDGPPPDGAGTTAETAGHGVGKNVAAAPEQGDDPAAAGE